MTGRRTSLLLAAALIAGCGGRTGSSRDSSPHAIDRALDAFQNGDADGADAILRDDPSADATFLRARLLLLRNRNEDAARLLAPLDRKARKFSEFDLIGQAHRYLARAHLRMDDFPTASRYFALKATGSSPGSTRSSPAPSATSPTPGGRKPGCRSWRPSPSRSSG